MRKARSRLATGISASVMMASDAPVSRSALAAVAMALRLDASDERLPEVPVLMLLDRVADVHLAKRSAADGWLVKPFDALTLKRAVKAVLSPAAEPAAAAEAEEEVPVAG